MSCCIPCDCWLCLTSSTFPAYSSSSRNSGYFALFLVVLFFVDTRSMRYANHRAAGFGCVRPQNTKPASPTLSLRNDFAYSSNAGTQHSTGRPEALIGRTSRWDRWIDKMGGWVGGLGGSVMRMVSCLRLMNGPCLECVRALVLTVAPLRV